MRTTKRRRTKHTRPNRSRGERDQRVKKKLALIHTVSWYEKSVVKPFADAWLKESPGVEIMNIMDDSLLSDSLADGRATPAVLRRIVLYVMAAEAAGADVAMVSCTTVGEASRIARKIVSIPVFNIDEPMAREAVERGERLGIVATVPTSAPATERLLKEAARDAGKSIEVQTIINEEAFRCLLRDDTEKHDELVRQEMDKLAGRVDAIVLGQISLSQIRHETKVPVLQVGKSGFGEATRLLNQVRA